MRQIFRQVLNRFRLHRYRRRVEYVLARAGRGGVRRDGLRLDTISSRLEIRWRARDVHPWDRDLPPERRAPAFVQQSVADTEAVISQLFESLPEVDVIDLAVVEPASAQTILAGTVERSAWSAARPLLSVKMRLKQLGVRFWLDSFG